MRSFFDRIRWGVTRFMQGRYGTDELNGVLLVTGLVMSLLSNVKQLSILAPIAMVLLFYALFRSFSRNYDARGRECRKYMALKGKLTGFFSLQKRRFTDRKTHRYFRCKQCKTVLRVPRGKGTLAITCPRCQTKVTHKT